MQNKTPVKRYFNQEKSDGPPDKKQKFQKKQKQGAFAKPQDKAKFRSPKETAKQNGGGPLKKMTPFPGTAQLHVKKAEKKQKNQEVPSIKTDAPSTEVKMNRAKHRRLRNHTKRQATRKNFSSVVESMQKGDEASIESIKEKIANIKSRDTLTNTARKKLRKFQSILRLAGVATDDAADVKDIKRVKVGKNVVKTEKNVEAKKQNRVQQNVKKLPVKKPVEEENEDSEEEEEDSSEADEKIAIKPEDDEDKESSDDEEEFTEVDNSKAEFLTLEPEDESGDEEASDEEDEDDDDDDDDEEEDDTDDEEEKIEIEPPKEAVKTPQKQKNKQNESPKDDKSRYVVFVGNLPYTIEKEQIMQHFKKVGDIQDIRIATDPNTKKGRGFAYVEVKNEESYQKALALHNTFVAGRKINVEYTKGGKKKGDDAKKQIKAKNMKLWEMRKQGKFAGAKNPSQKRAERRFKQKGSK